MAHTHIALLRLCCPAHGQEHWLAVPGLPDPPPSPDVLRQAVATHLWCGTQPLAVGAVVLVPDPVVLPWSALLPLPDDDAAPLSSLPTATAPAPAPAAGATARPAPEPSEAPQGPPHPHAHAQPPALRDVTEGQGQGPGRDLRFELVVVRPRDGARLRITWWHPFRHRTDGVLGLSFPYDPALILDLKAALRRAAPSVVDRRRHISSAGGWLADHRRWFVEVGAWPWVGQVFRTHGYPVPDDLPW